MVHVLVPFPDACEALRHLRDEITIDLYDGQESISERASRTEFYVPPIRAAGPAVEIMASMPQLRVVQTLSSGVDTIRPYVPRWATLCNAAGAHATATAEWVIGAILALLRELPHYVLAQKRPYVDYRFTDTLAGKKVLIVGHGHVGKQVHRRIQQFEADVVCIARTERPGVRSVKELSDLVPSAEVIVLAAPATPETRHMVNEQLLARMRPGTILVNGARGSLVDTDALTRAVIGGRIRAALDVTEPQPLPDEHPLRRSRNVLITPHLAGATPLSRVNALAIMAAQLSRYLARATLQYVVQPAH